LTTATLEVKGTESGQPSAAGGNSLMLTVGEVAEMLRCSERHVYRMSDAGKMPAPRKLGTLVRWSRQEIEDWARAGCPSMRAMKGAQH
jgi:excisionase family DNA binding protein